MSITYTWKIKEVKVRDEGSNQDAVIQTYWQKNGIDENNIEGTFDGATPFTSKNIPPDEFIPFDQLTEAIVLSWIQNEINKSPGYSEHIDNVIEQAINLKKNPIVEKPLPWSNT